LKALKATDRTEAVVAVNAPKSIAAGYEFIAT
jgi:hypothetical protein